MFSHHLYDFSLKVICGKILKNKIEKKWFKCYEGSDYQQVIHENDTKMLREWYEKRCNWEGEGREWHCSWMCDNVKQMLLDVSKLVSFALL